MRNSYVRINKFIHYVLEKSSKHETIYTLIKILKIKWDLYRVIQSSFAYQ